MNTLYKLRVGLAVAIDSGIARGLGSAQYMWREGGVRMNMLHVSVNVYAG